VRHLDSARRREGEGAAALRVRMRDGDSTLHRSETAGAIMTRARVLARLSAAEVGR
jgi:hypothetical protein